MGEKYNILMVDDEVSVLNSLYFILHNEEEYELFSVKSAEEMFKFLDECENEKIPDIILLDIIMPGMNGFEAAEILSTDDRYKDINIIFITGLTDASSELKGYSLGAKDYIYKPFNDSHLRRRIHIQKELSKLTRDLNNVKEKNRLSSEGAS